jgi:phosphatidylserine decarboxylase
VQLPYVFKTVFSPIHHAGWPFVFIFVVATAVLWWLAAPLGWVGVLLTLWCIYFFRDPERVSPTREGLIISPADGTVHVIDEAVPPPELKMGDQPRPRVAIFMNALNVHVNRIPCPGKITTISYRPGKYLNASLEKASVDNERNSVRLRLDDGQDIAFVQIAGLIARRILCDIKVGQIVQTGERFGMIRFGSRVEVFLPNGVNPLVAVGQTSVAGETVLADRQSQEPTRHGETR